MTGRRSHSGLHIRYPGYSSHMMGGCVTMIHVRAALSLVLPLTLVSGVRQVAAISANRPVGMSINH